MDLQSTAILHHAGEGPFAQGAAVSTTIPGQEA